MEGDGSEIKSKSLMFKPFLLRLKVSVGNEANFFFEIISLMSESIRLRLQTLHQRPLIFFLAL